MGSILLKFLDYASHGIIPHRSFTIVKELNVSVQITVISVHVKGFPAFTMGNVK